MAMTRVRYPWVRMLPNHRTNCPARGGWIYVILYSDARIKIGCSRNPRHRVMQHLQEQEDRQIVRFHLCGRVSGHLFNTERLALSLAAGQGERIRNTERFAGLSFQDAIACVRTAMRVMGEPNEQAIAVPLDEARA